MNAVAVRATALLTRLMDAADDDRLLRAALDATPLSETAAALVDELVFRADRPTNTELVRVGVDVVDRDERASFVVSLIAGKPVEVAPGPEVGEPGLHVEYTASDLVRALFGPPAGVGSTARRTVQLYNQARDATTTPSYETLAEVHRAVDALLAGTDPERGCLDEWAVRYGTDKWGGLHWFTPHYQRHFRRLRDRPVRVLEIGIGGFQDPNRGGESLRLWKRYFRRGLVYGMDIFPKNGLDEARLTTVLGDQSDAAGLAELAERHGPFDIVIDDGSHQNDHVLTTFSALFPYVRPGGFYVIEDLWTTYNANYGGQPGTTGGPGTSVGLLKDLLDQVQYEEWSTGSAEPAANAPAATLAGMFVYHNIAFLEKGVNAEGGVPEWIRSWPLS